MTTLDILRGARELIATPERWTKGWFARDTQGNKIYLPDLVQGLGRPACYCLDGAMIAFTRDLAIHRFGVAVAMGFHFLEDMYIWQDAPERTHAEVLARLDTAIEKLKSQAVRQ